jgi:hypothetical protein
MALEKKSLVATALKAIVPAPANAQHALAEPLDRPA